MHLYTKEIMKDGAKRLVKQAWITAELYAPIVYGTINEVFNKKNPEHSDLLRDLEVFYECEQKVFSDYNAWKVTFQYDPILKSAQIWLSVNSEKCKEEIVLSAHENQFPYWERMFEILMKFEDSWQEKARFILEGLETFNQRAKSKDPVIAKILDQTAEKILAHYDEMERTEEKLRASEDKNKENAEQRIDFLRFLHQISDKLEKTKQCFKSKRIAEIREEVDKKIGKLLAEGEDVEMLRSWTKEWASKQRIKR